jgi:peptidoglycan hydrolase CwlO-like protein
MRNRPLAFAAVCSILALLAVGVASIARAQGNSSAASTTSAQPQISNQSNPAPSPAPAPSKKVWTNEDVSDLRGESVISTVGDPHAKPGSKPAPAAKNADARPYQAQIARLEAQIPDLDRQIADIQSAIDGKPTGDAKSSQRPRSVKADSWEVEMQDLQKKRDNVEAQISALKDQARHHGVNPNTLP